MQVAQMCTISVFLSFFFSRFKFAFVDRGTETNITIYRKEDRLLFILIKTHCIYNQYTYNCIATVDAILNVP